MQETSGENRRVRVVGGRFERGARHWWARGVCYGPFPTSAEENWFPHPDAMAKDFDLMVHSGFNCVRLFHPPTETLVRLAAERDMVVWAGFPWQWETDFVKDEASFSLALEGFHREVQRWNDEPVVAAWAVANEVESTLVRWMGNNAVLEKLEAMVAKGREADPHALFYYANYPPTEWLVPDNADVAGINLYLEDPEALRAYIRRCHHFCAGRPMLVSEFGMDRLNHGEQKQAEFVKIAFEIAREEGAAGLMWFTWSDDWRDARTGSAVQGWKFGLVNEMRLPHPALDEVAEMFAIEEKDKGSEKWEWPKVSVLICTRNGRANLPGCMAAVSKLDYPDFEIVLVDDGSVDGTAGYVAGQWPNVRLLVSAPIGLGRARNLAAASARGAILAYTDDDCEPDGQWLRGVVAEMERHGYAAAGGPNLPPTGGTKMQSVLDRLPGLATHVMLNDLEAEHLPGCNLVVRAEVFRNINGFDEAFQTAGDDVDFCWRIMENGGRLGFVPWAVVWHHRRTTPWGSLLQQFGYGKAEAMLAEKWKERVGPGGAKWAGIVYGQTRDLARVYRGAFGHAGYAGEERWRQGTRPPQGITGWYRRLFRLLSYIQPWARAIGRWRGGLYPVEWPKVTLGQYVDENLSKECGSFWHGADVNRVDFIHRIGSRFQDDGWDVEMDDGWKDWDLRVSKMKSSAMIVTVTEYTEKAEMQTWWRVIGDEDILKSVVNIVKLSEF